MKKDNHARLLIVSALTLSIAGAGWWTGWRTSTLAAPTATITIEEPDGVDDVVGNGNDFATTVLGDPWDMNEHTDILAIHHTPNATISNGELTFVTEDNYTSVHILFPGADGRVDVGKVGMNYPIDTSIYRWMSFRMYNPGGSLRIKWFYGRYGDPNRPWVLSERIGTVPGWHTYIIDLENAAGNWNSTITDWEGMVPGLTIAVLGEPGSLIKIDWVRLTADNPMNNSLDISWSGLDPVPNNLEFHLDTDTEGCDGTVIHTESTPQTSGTFTWQETADGMASPANVAAGDYYVCALADDSLAGYSTGQLTVNQSPIIHFTQPSFTSGEDYATEAGNPWDMGERADISYVANGSYSTDGDVTAVTVPADLVDVQVHLNTPSMINQTRYYYLTYRLWFDYPYGMSSEAQNMRIFWGRSPETEATSELIYDYPGWQAYTVDLRSLPLHHGIGWNTANWDIFRIDPIANHTGKQVTFYLDDILLTGDEEADTFTEVMWEMTDPDTTVTTMTLYYDDDQTGMNGTPITSLSLENGEQRGESTMTTTDSPTLALSAKETLSETVYLPLVMNNYTKPCQGACYTWYTESITPGTYYLYACVEDGYNQSCRYSESPLVITH